tara:strand:- start:11595 stop:11801 length:207 start_codon:yes stop_codon:yes gene_type:complete
MSLLYKDPKDIKISCDVSQVDGKIILNFSADCGKFGTDEMLDGFTLTPERLLEVLQSSKIITDDENYS